MLNKPQIKDELIGIELQVLSTHTQEEMWLETSKF